jgi:hypothetical protein
MLRDYNPAEMYDLYHDLLESVSYNDKEIIFDLLIKSGFRGNEEQTLFDFLYGTYLANDEFRCKIMFMMLEAGYDIGSTERGKLDALNMAMLVIGGHIGDDKIVLLKKFLTYKPDLSDTYMDDRTDLINLAIRCWKPEIVRLLLEYKCHCVGTGSNKYYVRNIEYIMVRLKCEYPNVVDTEHLTDFSETNFERKFCLRAYIDSLNHLKQYTPSLTKSCRISTQKN